ncbi:hypothetical protein CC2G_015259 [Coprinopsis cinerea AmutBmut pab1-1]|nr:hypothetical protein CC2G_004817 [Coprinopsis cinerea AmutBmut pab1-1]KAG2007565.1 hypothetical protein CC2G_015259 [Coprinopsis cinerea AmutBmut pab1-1]
MWCGAGDLGWLARLTLQLRGPASPPPPSCGEWEVRNLSIRQEEKGLCTTSPGEGEWGGLCMADRGGPSSAIEREVLRL